MRAQWQKASRVLRLAIGIGALGLGSGFSSESRAEGWTPFISDEDEGFICAGTAERLTAMQCAGDYCDEIRFFCRLSEFGSYSDWRWTSFFSEEDGQAGTCWFPDRGQGVITGMDCHGDYCDDVSLECGRLPAGRVLSGCYDTAWVSEENGGFLFFPASPNTKGARSAKCSGDYCDAMQFNICDGA